MLAFQSAGTAVLSGFDAGWGFASPSIARSEQASLSALGKVLSQTNWQAALIPGLRVDDYWLSTLKTHGEVFLYERVGRSVALIGDGFEAWFSRRSRRFRKTHTQALKAAETSSVSFEFLQPNSAEFEAVWSRIVAVEHSSWKGRVHDGLTAKSLAAFTKQLAKRFVQRKEFFVLFATVPANHRLLRFQSAELPDTNQVDVGFVIGASNAGYYRGFQHTIHQAFKEIELGKALQYLNIQDREAHQDRVYDMGMAIPYKDRYCDLEFSSLTALIRKPGI